MNESELRIGNIITLALLDGSLKCEYWQDVIIKYHKEVGYKYLNPEVVNEH